MAKGDQGEKDLGVPGALEAWAGAKVAEEAEAVEASRAFGAETALAAMAVRRGFH